MKIPVHATVAAVVLSACSGSFAAITSYFEDFSGGSTSLTEKFAAASNGAVVGFEWSATAGVGGGAGITITSSTSNKFYRPTPYSDATSAIDMTAVSAGQGFRFSTDFVWSNTASTALTVLNVGFVPASTSASAMSSSTSMGGSIIRNGSSTVQMRLRSGATDVATLGFSQSLFTAGQWYRLVYETRKTDTANTFNSVLTLYSLGLDGTLSPVLMMDGGNQLSITSDVAVIATSVYSDATSFAVYDVRNTDGISALDNLGMTFIPEPSSVVFVSLGALGMVAGRRRK